MYTTTTPLSPRNPVADCDAFAYPNAQRILMETNHALSNPLASAEIYYSNEAYSTRRAERPLTSLEHTRDPYITRDFYELDPRIHSPSDYIVLNIPKPIDIIAPAPSPLHPAMALPADLLQDGHNRVATDNCYPALSYSMNMNIDTNKDSSPVEITHTTHTTEVSPSMTSSVIPTENIPTRSAQVTKAKRKPQEKVKSKVVSSGPLKCPECDKSFARPFSLKLHMRSHSTEKPFKCPQCEKRFGRCHDMKRHQQLHQGIRIFTCQGFLSDGVTRWGCGKKFARSDALTRHMKAEAGKWCLKPLVDEAAAHELEKSQRSALAPKLSPPDDREQNDTYQQPYQIFEMPLQPYPMPHIPQQPYQIHETTHQTPAS